MNGNIMFCSCGRRVQLLKFLKQSLGASCTIVAVDNNPLAPALYSADRHYIVPKIDSPEYIDTILHIAKSNEVAAICTLIDPEIEILSRNRDIFEKEGILVFAPSEDTARLCFDKYEMYKALSDTGIPTPLTYGDLASFKEGYEAGEIAFPVFVKPRTGSGSVGAHIVKALSDLEEDFAKNEFDYIIQELMTGGDCDADVYVDYYSHRPVSVFSKRKIETKIGGASKTISFKDPDLCKFVETICETLEFRGAVDMDFWYKDGRYLLSEINPRFGGAYLHAFGAGVDFFKYLQNNINGIVNEPDFGNYRENLLMLMYDAVEIIDSSTIWP